MPPAPDDIAVPIGVVCDMVGVTRQVRSTWIQRKLIGGRTAGNCTEEEALDFAAFAHLAERLGFEEARVAWPQVRDVCRLTWDQAPLEIVVDLTRKRAHVAYDDAGVGKLVRHGNAVRVIDLGDRLAQLRSDLRRVADILEATDPK